jgi:hypothetical protein
MKRKKSVIAFIAFIIIFILIVALLARCSNVNNQEAIRHKVESVGGHLIKFERKGVFKKDPFPWYLHGKHVSIYTFQYSSEGKTMDGWLLAGGFKKHWIMNEQEG